MKASLYTKLGGIETAEKPIFVDLTPVLGKRTWLASAFHMFANVTLVKGRMFLLTLSEDRAKKEPPIWTPPGEEVKVREGQLPEEAAVAEVYEEVGIKISPENLLLIGNPQVIYPTKQYDPYKGVGLIIFSYLYRGEWNPRDIKINTVPEKDCMIVDYRMIPLPNPLKQPLKKDKSNAWGSVSVCMDYLKETGITIYPNYAEKIVEANKIEILCSL